MKIVNYFNYKKGLKMKRILLLMSFIGAGYAASYEKLPPSLVKSLTDSGENGAQYVLIVNKYDAQAGYYADVWAFNGKELKHANHIKNVDVNKILGAGTALVGGKEAISKIKQDKKSYEQEVAKDKKALKKDKAKLEKDIKETKSKAKIKSTKAAKKQLDEAQTDYKKTGEAIKKAKTEDAKKISRAAHARSGKALIKAENALK